MLYLMYNTNCALSQVLLSNRNGTLVKYIYGVGLIGEERHGYFQTYHYDYRGSTIAITNECGELTFTFAYDTYGKLLTEYDYSDAIFLYNGRDGVITDKNGLVYMRARYYSPEMRRFINADIIPGEIFNAITLNRYAYANGNPVSNVDPFGLASEDRTGGDNTNANKTNSYLTSNYDFLGNFVSDIFNWSVDTFKALTANGYLDWFLALTLGITKDDKGIYHIAQDYWQSWHFVGYNDLYDWAFDIGTSITGTSMQPQKFPFTSGDGTQYIIWAWKGDYINLGSGAEVGIYKESIIPGHWLTSTENSMPMTLSLKEIDSGKVLFDYAPTEKQWWINGFDSSSLNAQANNLQATVTIDFSNNYDLYEGFFDSYGTNNKKSPWSFDGKVATLTW